MPHKASNPEKRSTQKHKATDRARATERIAERQGTHPPVKVPQSTKQRSQQKFPGETPLTGETGRSARSGIEGRNFAAGERRGNEPPPIGQRHGPR